MAKVVAKKKETVEPVNEPRKSYRQGDVMLLPVDAIPAGATPVEREAGRLILAHGTATGHSHAFDVPNASLFQSQGVTYLRVDEAPAAFVHDEHRALTVRPGAYEVRRQREYAPQASRMVQD